MIVVMAFLENVNEYARDKNWAWHVPLWLFGLYAFTKLLSFDLIDPQPMVLAVPHAFDFMLHEIAHIMTGWLPPMVAAASGSFSELLLGGILVHGAFFFRNYFAMLFCCLWFMLVCMSVGSYMADAVPQAIPLVSLGGALAGSEQAVHDWNFIFGELGWLGSSGLIGNAVKGVGVAVGLFGVVFSAWIIYKMAAAKDEKPPMTSEELTALKASVSPSGAKKPVYPEPTKGSLSGDESQKPPGSGQNRPSA